MESILISSCEAGETVSQYVAAGEALVRRYKPANGEVHEW